METLTFGKAVTMTVTTEGEPILEVKLPLGHKNLLYGILDALKRGVPKSYHDVSNVTIQCGDVTLWDRRQFNHIEFDDAGYVSFLMEWRQFTDRVKEAY